MINHNTLFMQYGLRNDINSWVYYDNPENPTKAFVGNGNFFVHGDKSIKIVQKFHKEIQNPTKKQLQKIRQFIPMEDKLYTTNIGCRDRYNVPWIDFNKTKSLLWSLGSALFMMTMVLLDIKTSKKQNNLKSIAFTTTDYIKSILVGTVLGNFIYYYRKVSPETLALSKESNEINKLTGRPMTLTKDTFLNHGFREFYKDIKKLLGKETTIEDEIKNIKKMELIN